MGEILMPAVSAAGAAAFILAFSLSLDFWGRLVLRAVKAGDAAEPESMLGCAAGAAAAFVACRWLSFFTRSFETPLTAFVALGAIGALWRLASELRASKADPARPSALESLRAAVAAREWAVVVSLLAFVLAFWFCSLWPSGEMEPWLTQSADYYSWTFFAGYWMGYGDAETYGIMNLHRWIFDAFGTNILYAMYSSARGVPAYIASGGFEILVLSWTGCAIYVLVRRLAGFPRWLAWLAALGVVGGWFCRFLMFGGLIGQLVAIFGYLLLMRPALSSSGTPPSRRGGFARVFVPLLFVFLSYQAGYVMFAAIFCAARFLRLSFGGDHG
ncbi:MAG: hypothetical protein LBQ79_03855, partial [Deltaproteobacteria bacterium]|nr:hypothetical protein [Deltaproteobacteria bacterium]